MTKPILLTGGTGTLGRKVLPRLLAAGRPVRVLSRTPNRAGNDHDGVEYATGDLLRDEGLADALRDVGTVVHLAGGPSGDDVSTEHLVRRAEAAGVDHLVMMSVVGADRLPVRTRIDRTVFGYFATKRRAEEIVSSSALGWSTLRSTQFHESLGRVIGTLTRSPVVPVFAGFRFQPLAADEVAATLIEMVEAGPAGLVPEWAGPRTYTMRELARRYLDHRGLHRVIVPVPVVGPAARAYRAGANLAPDRAVGRTSWDDFLTAQLTAPPGASRPGPSRRPAGR